MRALYHVLLAAASTSPMVLIFAVNTDLSVFPVSPLYCSHLLVLTGIVTLNILVLLGFRALSSDSMEGALVNIESANHIFLPNYLGYFFVAVSIARLDTFLLVYGLTTLFVFLSQSMYYNPLFLLCGYRFYQATNTKGARLFLITRRQIRAPQGTGAQKMRRINDFTYIENER